MGILDEDVVRVRDSADIVGVISEHTALRKVGTGWSGLCPFHPEKSPSFSVNAEKGVYHCFGCGVGGDVIKFVREIEHLDFVGAVELLAARSGITLRYTEADQGESRKRRTRLVGTVDRAVDWYHERLLTSPDAAKARSYLRSRGFDSETVRQYRLGWAPDAWDELARSLKLQRTVAPDGPSEQQQAAIDAGLVFANSRNRLTDVFRNRLLFPIFDPQGDAVGFGGRILPGTEGPKYKNSSQSAVYDKSKVLYGLNWAKAAVVAADEVIVCEGYTDVIGFARAGAPRAVATCGTALTEDHVRLLRKFARRVVLAFDADSAGQAAADRFYEWERSLDLDVSVADLPAGVDPGELAQRDPERLVAAVTGSQPFLGFRVERILAAGSLASPEARARTAEAALVAIAEHPSEFVRDQYVMEVASRCRIEPDRLRSRLAAGPQPAGSAVAPSSPSSSRPRSDGDPRDAMLSDARPRPRASRQDSPEAEALRLAISRADEIRPWLDEVLFTDESYLLAYRALVGAPDYWAAVGAADPDTADLLQRLAVEDATGDVDDVVNLLLLRAARASLGSLEARVTALSADPDAVARTLAESARLRLWIEELRSGAPAIDVVEQLLGWLATETEVLE